jgi:monoamine oxidase
VTDPATLHGGLVQKKLSALEKDETVDEFMEREFPGEEFRALRDMTYRRVEGYDAADPKRMSAFALREEFDNDNGWVQKNLKEGYGVLVRFLEKQCVECDADVHLNVRVSRIKHSDRGVDVTCEDQTTYQARKVLVTVPLPLIREIEFVPAIPEKLEAASKMGYGPVIKTLIRFKEKWWTGNRERHFERMFFLFSDEKIPTWWTQYPEAYTTLTGWVGGPRAHALAARSDDELLDIALASLSSIFQLPVEELRGRIIAWKVLNWEKDPLARGAYSYPVPETGGALKVLGEPVNEVLYFAGEAFGESANATVEGALASGQKVAREMLA